MEAIEKKIYHGLLMLFLILSFGSIMAQSDDDNMDMESEGHMEEMQDQESLINDAKEAITIFMNTNAEAKALFNSSAGYVVFPNVGKGAYIVGGAAGNGVVYEKGEIVGMAKLKQIDIGLQLGGQAFRQVIFFETEKQLNEFKKGNFELSGNVSAVVLEEGKAKSIDFTNGLAVVTMPKAGAMIEIAVGGQKFEYEAIP
ncbi:YSC84-related protein [Gillisia sp. JM1]|uniref:lipid-binding SYLF domain-containing protein n=1 Tax=Gillisia sp. JM1 TaxID=1283286 RepID=UPI00040FE704|nr:lipid-binding SYLF domain-containing protein [Gillisia sp. JM1]